MLSISTSLPYNGDRNLIIQRHANVAVLVFTYRHLITMPLTLCNLLCELGHIKNVSFITDSHGTTEDRPRIMGMWKRSCWALHCCKAKTGCQTQWLLIGFAELLAGNRHSCFSNGGKVWRWLWKTCLETEVVELETRALCGLKKCYWIWLSTTSLKSTISRNKDFKEFLWSRYMLSTMAATSSMWLLST